MNFRIEASAAELAARVRAFVSTEVLRFESDPRWGDHGPSEDLRRELNDKARAAGLLAPNAPREYGGMALSHLAKAAVFEAAGYSMLGPVALHIQAPDEGNLHLLSKVASPAHKERFLKPLAEARIRSCFAMTEPAPGAGSDPAMLATRATPDGGGFVVNGRKWLTTGADGASFAILMARTGDGAGDATMFLVPLPNPAIRIVRRLTTMDTSFMGGHAEIEIEGLRLDEDAVLGEVGKGFRYAQVRLAPARLTHCMRWLGAAVRAHETAVEYARARYAFGARLGAHERVSFMLADNAMDIHVTRLAIQHCAWTLDEGARAGTESSMTKVIASEAIMRVVDRSLQILGGLGMTRDSPVERIFRDVRAFRIYDGPSEVHRWSLGHRIVDAKD
jgi:alkylation response protein AidB-like acyl-CoA dehydrogenase